jgi:predicted ATPase
MYYAGMRLTTLSVQGYRSLYDVHMKPGDFSAIVGPNNAGKTNFVDALQFLGEIARSGLEVAVGREGGFENLAFRRQRRRRGPVSFCFTARMESSEMRRLRHVPRPARRERSVTIEVTYSFALRASSESRDADYRVASENLTITAGPRPVLELQRTDQDISVKTVEVRDPTLKELAEPFEQEAFLTFVNERTETTELALNRMTFNPVVESLIAALGRTRLFQLNPVECRKPGASTPNPELERHGANLPAVVRYIKQHEHGAWEAVMVAMRRIMPGLTSIETHYTADRHLSLLFAEHGTRGWTANEVSDGTIQSLALFTCLFDPRVPLVLIEEPENAVHPWIVRTFVEGCREATAKQILLTTHSPALIAFLKPNELDVMWRSSDGHSHVCDLLSLDPQAEKLWADGTVDLFQLIDGGWLREAIPPGLA